MPTSKQYLKVTYQSRQVLARIEEEIVAGKPRYVLRTKQGEQIGNPYVDPKKADKALRKMAKLSPAANTRVFDDIIQRQILLERYKAGVIRQLAPVLKSAIADITAKIRALPQNSTRAHLEKALVEIKRINEEMSSDLSGSMLKELQRLAHTETVFTHAALSAAIPAQMSLVIALPNRKFLERMVATKPFQGLTLEEWTKRIGQSATLKARQQLYIGLAEGETVDKIAKRFAFIGDQSMNDLQMVARTAINNVASQAKSAVYKENADVIKGVMWRSTLDEKTSEICQARDGEMYDTEDHPVPPAHPNCRSTIVPVVKSFRELGFDYDEVSPGTRASMDGQVPASETYNTWLRKQPEGFVEDVLGRERAQLYLRGDLTLDKFVNDAGKRLTLDELAKKYPSAF